MTTSLTAAQPAELPDQPVPDALGDPGTGPQRSSGSPWRLAWRRLRADRIAMISLGAIVFMSLVAILAPVITALYGHSPGDTFPDRLNRDLGGLPKGGWGGISGRFWFGIEPATGHDMLSLSVYGARTSLFIAAAATLLTVIIAVLIGLPAGYFGGWVDQVLSRFTDIVMTFPSFIFMIALIAVLPDLPRIPLLIGLMAVFSWPYLARLLRGQVISLREREFVEAARSLGATHRAIVFHELLPNLVSPIIVTSMLMVPSYIGFEAALSFLGLGVQPGTPSWGELLSASLGWYATDPMYFVIPGLLLTITVLAFNLLGDAMQNALNPRRAR